MQIVQLQHKKLAMTEAALSTDPDAALGKLTVEDVSDIPGDGCGVRAGDPLTRRSQLGFLFKM